MLGGNSMQQRSLSAAFAGLLASSASAAAEEYPRSPDIAASISGKQTPYSEMKLDDLGPKKSTYNVSGRHRISPRTPPGVHCSAVPRVLFCHLPIHLTVAYYFTSATFFQFLVITKRVRPSAPTVNANSSF